MKYYETHSSDTHYDLLDQLPVCNYNPVNINQAPQNQPEMVVQDLKEAFDLNEVQAEYVRYVMLKRGINKWMYARRKFIDLKHIVKRRMKQAEIDSNRFYIYQELNEKMQHIAKTPRWVEWPKKIHNSLENAQDRVIVKKKLDQCRGGQDGRYREILP
mgnify:CR=1 FL=1